MASRCSVVLLLGPPASGKTTLGKKLAQAYDYFLFDVGTHIRDHLPRDVDVETFAYEAVVGILATKSKVILSGYPKWPSGLDHLLGCDANIDLSIHLEPYDKNILAQRALFRHISGERPEDNDLNFQSRLQSYEDNVSDIRARLVSNGTKLCFVSPMNLPDLVEREASHMWRVRMRNVGRLSSLGSIQEGAVRGRTTLPMGSIQEGAVRGRTTLPEIRGSRARNDPDEREIEVSLQLFSGEELLRPRVPLRSTVARLRRELVAAGETEFDLEFSFLGEVVNDNDIISRFNGFEDGCIVNVLRKDKPPPPPPCYKREYSPPCCFSADSVVRVLRDAKEVQCQFSQVKVGDLVRTSQASHDGVFRRVQRVWAHPCDPPLETFEVAQGCRLTLGHPFVRNGSWRRPESVCKAAASLEPMVYQLEVEGHVDTVLVGSSRGVVCALLGCYCGEDFGWNLFTRKTVRCDKGACKKCDKACLPGLSFDESKITEQMVRARYEPY
eukprot:TRINITY_DN244_c0_g1_i1.p1 TRINITY_DN244_c0_g1~~TRINITY_DN244_c0_g1_i1.p1  ORF type:complete len:541 (-),score=60.97 TRINITY_DN244_c0_g1_i1:75-1565(-)